MIFGLRSYIEIPPWRDFQEGGPLIALKQNCPYGFLALLVLCIGPLCACTEFLDVSLEEQPQDTSPDDTDSGSDTSSDPVGICLREPIDDSESGGNCSEFYGAGWEADLDESQCTCDPPGDHTCTWSQTENCDSLGSIGTCTCEHSNDELEIINYYYPTPAATAEKKCGDVAASCTWQGTLSMVGS